jgi:NADH-quinone oxidoreductase subunit C
MDAAALVQALREALTEARIDLLPSVDLHTTIRVDARDWPALARLLRDRGDLRFALLIDLTAVDHYPREPRFELVCLLVSIEHRRRLRVRVPLAGDDPHVGTVSDVWPAANWLEREVLDLFGIAFDGHPDPRRLLMPEVQVNLPVETRSALQMTEAEFRANVERDRRARR